MLASLEVVKGLYSLSLSLPVSQIPPLKPLLQLPTNSKLNENCCQSHNCLRIAHNRKIGLHFFKVYPAENLVFCCGVLKDLVKETGQTVCVGQGCITFSQVRKHSR